MVKSAVYLAGFYIIFYLFLGRDTQYTRNRIYLVSSLILAMILPLISVRIPSGSVIYSAGKAVTGIFVTPGMTLSEKEGEAAQKALIYNYAGKVYLGVVLLFFLKFFADLAVIIVMILRRGKPDSRIITFENFNSPGFSALGYIFINRSLGPQEAAEVIRHEHSHLERRHFLDIMLLETVKSLQWFNPFIYLYNRSLRAVHEYQADRECLSSGQGVAGYQALLLNTLLNTKIFITSNSFSNPSLIRKRMIMMTRKRSPEMSVLKVLFVVPLAAALMLIISACEKIILTNGTNPRLDVKIVKPEIDAPKEIFVVVEEMPVFPGGEKALMEFIYSNIQYPRAAREKGIEGRVILRFCVNYLGGIDNVSVLKGVDAILDDEAVRVIKMLPRWQPGKQGGKPVNVWYSVPVTFQLK